MQSARDAPSRRASSGIGIVGLSYRGLVVVARFRGAGRLEPHGCRRAQGERGLECPLAS